MRHYDYIVDANWHGPEGRIFYTAGPSTFKVFRTVEAAINDGANWGNMFVDLSCWLAA